MLTLFDFLATRRAISFGDLTRVQGMALLRRLSGLEPPKTWLDCAARGGWLSAATAARIVREVDEGRRRHRDLLTLELARRLGFNERSLRDSLALYEAHRRRVPLLDLLEQDAKLERARWVVLTERLEELLRRDEQRRRARFEDALRRGSLNHRGRCVTRSVASPADAPGVGPASSGRALPQELDSERFRANEDELETRLARPGDTRDVTRACDERGPTDAVDEHYRSSLAGRYELKDLLGEGEMGRVYRAYATSLGRYVAVKLAHPGGQVATNDRSRFRREIIATSVISHPKVVDVYDAGELSDGELFIAMELLPGESLDRTLDARGTLSIRVVLELATQLFHALAACHEARVVHRDVKPRNIQIWRRGDGLELRLVDFGLARLLPETGAGHGAAFLSPAHLVSGSPAYMAPEAILEPLSVDARCDLYGAGITMYEMLIGTPPFSGDTVEDVLMQQIEESCPSLDTVAEADGWPEGLARLLRGLLEKRREDRPATARVVLTELDRLSAVCDERADEHCSRLTAQVTTLFGLDA
jgi:hypothetical protein